MSLQERDQTEIEDICFRKREVNISMRPQQLVRIGELYLEEAVLDVLADAKRRLETDEVSDRAGIFCRKHEGQGYSYSIARGILNKLARQGKVIKDDIDLGYGRTRPAWKLKDSVSRSRNREMS